MATVYGLPFSVGTIVIASGRALGTGLTSLTAYLGHMLPIARDRLPALPTNARHMLSVLRHLSAALAPGRGMSLRIPMPSPPAVTLLFVATIFHTIC